VVSEKFAKAAMVEPAMDPAYRSGVGVSGLLNEPERSRLMKSAPSLLFSMLLLPVSALAQQGPAPSFGVAGMETLQGDARPSPSSAQACPVSMTARQTAATELVKVKKGPDPSPETLAKPGQRIHLILGGLPETGRITGATVTVRGLSARGHIDKTSGSATSDLRRTINVTFTPEDEKTFSAELVLPGFTAVKTVKLEALQFADSSTRDYAGANMCTVAPDPLMLVGR
jgi:hypothetical protein